MQKSGNRMQDAITRQKVSCGLPEVPLVDHCEVQEAALDGPWPRSCKVLMMIGFEKKVAELQRREKVFCGPILGPV